MSTLIDFSIFPLDKGESLSPYVARAVSVIEKSGLSFKLGPMGTSIGSKWDEVVALGGRCFKALKTDCNRIVMTLKVDYRKGTSERTEKKIHPAKEKQSR